MENWSLGEKEAVAALLVQYDLPEDRTAWEDALQESSARRREAALDALFVEHYAVTSGGRRNISLHSIMQQELGELDPEWSLEQKAAYSALESEFELGGADEDVNLLPGEDDIPREEAVQIAKDAIQTRITSRMRSIRIERASWRAMGRRSRRLSRRSSHGKISELTSC